jgi:hypothetical protein
MYDYRALIAIAEVEFSDLVDHVDDLGRKIRLYLKDGSYENVAESHLSDDPRWAMREFLRLVREKLQ